MKTIINHIQKSVIAVVMGAVLFFGMMLSAQQAHAQANDNLQYMVSVLLKQVAELQTQLEVTQGELKAAREAAAGARTVSRNAPETPENCVGFANALSQGSNDQTSGGEVSRLQAFLTETGDYSYGVVTGYYGPATTAAVQRWQARNGVVSSGSPETTGYGLVGERTRERLNESCRPTTRPTTSTAGTTESDGTESDEDLQTAISEIVSRINRTLEDDFPATESTGNNSATPSGSSGSTHSGAGDAYIVRPEVHGISHSISFEKQLDIELKELKRILDQISIR